MGSTSNSALQRSVLNSGMDALSHANLKTVFASINAISFGVEPGQNLVSVREGSQDVMIHAPMNALK